MRIAITGGTGFVGGQLAARLRGGGHEPVLVSRRTGYGLGTDGARLADAFAGCAAVVHCAGINREIGDQTYDRVHVAGTREVIDAALVAGVRRVVMLSFLRARRDGPTSYHRSKWAAEQIVRHSGLTYTIVKAGVIHGRGDHMLDHLSHAFHTFPIFGLVGLKERPVRPVAVDDVARILEAAALGDPRLANRTVAALGPDELSLGDAVRRVAAVTGRHPWFIRLPIALHLVIAQVAEWTMHVPLVSTAQVRILAEGIVEPLPFADRIPDDLGPRTPFSEDVIRRGLPAPASFGLADLRWCSRDAMTPASHPPRDAWTAFGLGVIGGVIGGLSLLSFAGIFLIAIIAIVGGLAVRPRPFGAAGVLLGWGVTWLSLLAAAQSRCDPASCTPPDLTRWVGAGLGLAAIGLVLLAVAIRRHGKRRA